MTLENVGRGSGKAGQGWDGCGEGCSMKPVAALAIRAECRWGAHRSQCRTYTSELPQLKGEGAAVFILQLLLLAEAAVGHGHEVPGAVASWG